MKHQATQQSRTQSMIDNRQQAYLEAMGIQLWSSRLAMETQTSSAVVEQTAVAQTTDEQAPDEQAPVQQIQSGQAQTGSESSGLKLGPGSGGVLLICAVDSDSASKLANDISRSMGAVPVWGWPDSGADAIKPLEAVAQNLFTTVAIFGDELAGQLLGDELPANLKSAKLVLLPPMHDLEVRHDARRELWATLCRSGMIAIV